MVSEIVGLGGHEPMLVLINVLRAKVSQRIGLQVVISSKGEENSVPSGLLSFLFLDFVSKTLIVVVFCGVLSWGHPL